MSEELENEVKEENDASEKEEITGYIRTDDGVDDTPDIYEDPLEPKRRAGLAHRHAAVAAIDAGEDEAAFNELVKAVDIYEETIMLGGNDQDIFVLGKTSGALKKLADRLYNRYSEMGDEAYRNMEAISDDPAMKQGFFREAGDCRDKAARYKAASEKYAIKSMQYGE